MYLVANMSKILAAFSSFSVELDLDCVAPICICKIDI